MPGTDVREPLRVVLGELPDLPHLPELPGRGPVGDLTGRATAVITELGFDLQPAGWRLTGGPASSAGIDRRRARSLLLEDLDVLEELAQGYAGELKVQIAGPWTLAAAVERPRGDRVLADVGARRELAEALAEGVAAHVADLRRRVPKARLLVQVDEPALPAVLAGRVPTASGFHRHRSVDVPGASEALAGVLAAVRDAGATPLVHCCAAEVPVGLLRGAGAAAVSVDLLVLGAEAYDALGTALDDGDRVFLGVVPAVDPPHPPEEGAVVERVLRFLDMLGLDPDEVGDHLVLTPACGLAGASAAYAREALSLLRTGASRMGTG